jgi:hypothetical protein
VNVQVTHVVVHTPEQVREIIREACDIANTTELEDDDWQTAFTAACRLLGQRHTIAMAPESVPLALPMVGIGRNGKM